MTHGVLLLVMTRVEKGGLSQKWSQMGRVMEHSVSIIGQHGAHRVRSCPDIAGDQGRLSLDLAEQVDIRDRIVPYLID